MRRTAELSNGDRHGHDLAHHFDDNRSHLTYGEPARHPMEQQQPLQLSPTQIQSVTAIMPPEPIRDISPTLNPPAHQFTCILPVVPRPVLTLLPMTASISVRRLKPDNPELMLPSSSRWEEVKEVHTNAQNTNNSAEENRMTNKRPRTILIRLPYDVPMTKSLTEVQDSYDALMPSTSANPRHLIGFQANPELQERQKEQQKAKKQATNAPINLRDVLNQKEQKKKLEQFVQKKRARKLAISDAASLSPNSSPVQQPEARRVRFA